MKRRILSKYDGKKEGWFKQFKELIVIFILILILLNFLVGVSFVKGTSMEPTLTDGEPVFYVRILKEYQRGDVVSVRMPSGEYYVKRVVAVAGDKVDLRNGDLYINDVKQEESYIKGVTEKEGIKVTYPCVVPEGRVFVLGDNREDSLDSRAFGSVMTEQIKGKLLFY